MTDFILVEWYGEKADKESATLELREGLDHEYAAAVLREYYVPVSATGVAAMGWTKHGLGVQVSLTDNRGLFALIEQLDLLSPEGLEQLQKTKERHAIAVAAMDAWMEKLKTFKDDTERGATP